LKKKTQNKKCIFNFLGQNTANSKPQISVKADLKSVQNFFIENLEFRVGVMAVASPTPL